MTTVPVRNRALGLAGAGVLAFALSACGGGPSGSAAPTDADVDDFCKTVGRLDTGDVDEFVDTLVETGTPADIPDEARAGFEVMVDKADEDAISEADTDKVNEFIAYIALTCGEAPAAN